MVFLTYFSLVENSGVKPRILAKGYSYNIWEYVATRKELLLLLSIKVVCKNNTPTIFILEKLVCKVHTPAV